jgi:hypothetical protein
MMNSEGQLSSLIREKYNALDALGVVAICPAQLAADVMLDIDPDGDSPALVQTAAGLALRQLARAVCRSHQIEQEYLVEQASLFEFKLQPRYPAEREGDDAYVLRSHLTIDERRKNITRLRREAEAKTLHADALEAETQHLVATGELVSVA